MIEPVPTHIDGERVPAELRVRLQEARQALHAAAFRKRFGNGMARTAEEQTADRTAGE